MLGICILLVFLNNFTCAIIDDDLPSCLTIHGVHNYTTHQSTSNSDAYHRLLYVSMQNQIFTRSTFPQPRVIILPESMDQLANVISCCTRGSWTIRLRSGGHSYEGLSHIADNPFVIIDLMNLNGISIDLDTQTAWVESGATLGEIYHAIGKSSGTMAFSAGYCPTGGSGGHIAPGGFGMMSRKYGLAADNVVDALLVDANGVVLDRESMGEDVFWAIRGGGGGVWGAVYAWKLQLVPVPKNVTIFRLMKHSEVEDASKLLHKWQLVAPKLEDDFSLAVLAGTNKDSSIWLTFLGLYLGPKELASSSMHKKFPELNLLLEDCMEMSWVEATAELAGLKSVSELKDRFLRYDDRAFKTKVDFPKEAIPLEGIQGALEILKKEQRGFMVMNGQGGMMDRISTDASPFPHRSGTLSMVEYIVAWDKHEDLHSNEFIHWLHQLFDYMGKFVSNNPRVGYVNHVDLDLGRIDWVNKTISSGRAIEIARTWGEKYFMSNYDRLVRAKTMIDPKNVFNHPQSIPPLLEIMLDNVKENDVIYKL
uniref:Berberine bridge enzyme n=1 Tax=Thalictrum flavum subsp. glaucum TaxID=150095 RepID=Q5C9L3_THLFG|nr:berberine bridge enzyme [Thalictrum flavum subsp. glaucum]